MLLIIHITLNDESLRIFKNQFGRWSKKSQ
uniref:Uncharacterized protein n=1 Tax=Anguilla anguilla TaxID=7936 RepID=A0A0E9VH69_ANGAN